MTDTQQRDPGFGVVIPARYGSTRLPGKPLRMLGGRPLIAWVWERACASAAAEVVVATDDQRIADACAALGAEVALTRGDHASGSERIAEVAATRSWPADRIVVNLQGDEPGIPPALIDQVAADLDTHTGAGMATLCVPIVDAGTLFDPHAVKVVIDAAGYALYFSRAPIPWHRSGFTETRSTLPGDVGYLRHIGLYAYRVGFLARYVAWPPAPLERAESLEQLRVLWQGERIHVAVAVQAPGPGVDTAADLERAQHWLAAR